MKLVPDTPSPIDPGDYSHGVMHLTWLEQDDVRHPVLAMVEMVPAEMPKDTSPPVRNRFDSSLGPLFHARWALSTQEALDWYEAARDGHSVGLPPTREMTPAIFFPDRQQEPPWPFLIVSNQIPLSPSHWGTVRSHLLFAVELPTAVAELTTSPEITNWLADHWYFNLIEYPDFLGCLALILPNPILRGFTQTMGKLAEGNETSDFHFITRAGKKLDGLTLLIEELRPHGRRSFRTVLFSTPYLRVEHRQGVERTAIAIFSDRYGLLDWHKPAGYLRSTHVTMAVAEGEKHVEVPQASKRRGAETYIQPIYSREMRSIVGDQNGPNQNFMDRLYSQAARRFRRDNAKKLGQTWFHGNQAEATEFVRSLISRARNRVWIIDPYFASIDLFRFAFATSSLEIDVLILTSAECMDRDDTLDLTKKAGEVLFAQVENREYRHGKKPEIKVMTGKNPEVHDRFLVIDDTIWFSGNSLNNIGERAGVMIKLPDPEPIIGFLDAIVNGRRTIGLTEWHRRRAEGECP